jgi:hypothetical protein
MIIMNVRDIWEKNIFQLSITQHTIEHYVIISNNTAYIRTLDMYITLYSNQRQIKATATGFMNETVNNIKKAIQSKDGVQWNIYSAHDTTVGNVLAALNFANYECVF